MALINFNSNSHRVIASRFPPTGIFDDVGNEEDAKIAMEVETLTGDRNTGALGRLEAIPKDDWVFGVPGANMAMAAFLYPAPTGGRFNSPALGAWYASLTVETAIKETPYHNTRRLAASEGGFPNKIQMRELISKPDAKLHDLTPREKFSDFYHETDYSTSQTYGEEIRKKRGDGLFFSSVRHPGGQNIVIFRPELLLPIIQGDHFEYHWAADGTSSVVKLTNVA